MGKNQAYKAMQRSRVGSSSGGPEEMEDGMADGSFHSPEWHAARLASLKTSHTITWEEFKRKQKEDEAKKGELEADKDKMMKEYRAQLDAERASKLAHGRNYSKNKSHHKKDRKEKEKDHKKKSSKRKKHSRRSSESSSSDSSSSDYSSSDDDNDDDREARRSKSRSGSSRRKRKESSKSRSKSRSKRSKSDSEDDVNGPLPLSKFFGNIKS